MPMGKTRVLSKLYNTYFFYKHQILYSCLEQIHKMNLEDKTANYIIIMTLEVLESIKQQ